MLLLVVLDKEFDGFLFQEIRLEHFVGPERR